MEYKVGDLVETINGVKRITGIITAQYYCGQEVYTTEEIQKTKKSQMFQL